MPIADPISPTSASKSGGRTKDTDAASKLTGQIRHQFNWLSGQAASKATQLAETGKDQLANKLDDVSGIVASTAKTAEQEYGPAAGQFVQRGADALISAAEGLRSKSVHGLVTSSRSLIRRNVGTAIGTAAVFGFVASRIAKGGTSDAYVRDDVQPQVQTDPVRVGAIV
jgi:hypothetical protein